MGFLFEGILNLLTSDGLNGLLRALIHQIGWHTVLGKLGGQCLCQGSCLARTPFYRATATLILEDCFNKSSPQVGMELFQLGKIRRHGGMCGDLCNECNGICSTIVMVCQSSRKSVNRELLEPQTIPACSGKVAKGRHQTQCDLAKCVQPIVHSEVQSKWESNVGEQPKQ